MSRGKLGRRRISLGRAGCVPISGVRLAHSEPKTEHCAVIPDCAESDRTDGPADQTSEAGGVYATSHHCATRKLGEAGTPTDGYPDLEGNATLRNQRR